MATQQSFLRAVFTSVIFIHTWAFAGPELDRVYQFEKISWLDPVDNMEGVLNDRVRERLEKFFSNHGRFQVVRLDDLNPLLRETKLPYYEVVRQTPVLRKIAEKYRVDSLIRTRIQRANATYRVEFEWVYAPKNDVVAKEDFLIQESLDGFQERFTVSIDEGLEKLIRKLPFRGQVTGVDQDVLTVNLGRDQGIATGEILWLSTIAQVKRHPIDQTLEEWRFTPVGRAKVEQVESTLSFARVIETEPGQKPLRFQKIVAISAPDVKPNSSSSDQIEKDDPNEPKLGWVSAQAGFGLYSREVATSVAGQNGRTGSGLSPQFGIESSVFLNSRLLAEGSLYGTLLSHSPKDLSTGSSIGTNYSGSATAFRLALGYTLFPVQSVFDINGWIHAGYRTTQYSLSSSATDFTGSSRVGSFFIGLGGEVPFRNGMTAQMGLDLGLLRSGNQTSPSFGEVSSSNDLMVFVAGTYPFMPQFRFRLLVGLNSQSLSFQSGQSVNQKILTISPGFMYYF